MADEKSGAASPVPPHEAVLQKIRALEWAGTDEHVNGRCAFCLRFPVEGHDADCGFAELLKLAASPLRGAAHPLVQQFYDFTTTLISFAPTGRVDLGATQDYHDALLALTNFRDALRRSGDVQHDESKWQPVTGDEASREAAKRMSVRGPSPINLDEYRALARTHRMPRDPFAEQLAEAIFALCAEVERLSTPVARGAAPQNALQQLVDRWRALAAQPWMSVRFDEARVRFTQCADELDAALHARSSEKVK